MQDMKNLEINFVKFRAWEGFRNFLLHIVLFFYVSNN
jgi:hypothetical protein